MRILFVILFLLKVASAHTAHYEQPPSGPIPLRALILRTYAHVDAEAKKSLHSFARTCLSDGDKPHAQSILNFGAQYLARTPDTDIHTPITLMTHLTGLASHHIQTITTQFFNVFHGHV